jgi:hypothetical protein
MFGSKQPSGAIDLSTTDLKDAKEIIRAFLPGQQQIIGGIYVDPPADLQPFGFGILLADLLHHGAQAYAYKFGLDVDQVRYAISQGLQAELSNPTDEPKQVGPES